MRGITFAIIFAAIYLRVPCGAPLDLDTFSAFVALLTAVGCAIAGI